MNCTNLLCLFSWLSETKLNKKQSGILNNYAVYSSVILFILSILSFDNSIAQNVSVSGANAGNGSYATLGAAFTAINGGSQTGANISVLIINGTTETATAQLNSGSWNSFSIAPSGGSKTISGNISGNALIRLDGADNVNIDGGVTSVLTFNNTSTSAHSTLLFINDACNNRLFRCDIRGVSTNANVVFGTGTATGNDNNVLDYCNIGDFTGSTPTYAVRFDGSASFPNNGDTIRNSYIYNFFSPAASSAGIRIGTGNSDITIYKNRFFQTSTRIMTAAVTHYVIWIENTAANNCSIIENTIGYDINHSLGGQYTVGGSHASSKFLVIYVNGGSTSIQGNIFTAITFTGIMAGTFGATPFTYIFINWGSANIGNEKRNYFGGIFSDDSTYVSTSGAETHVFGIYMTGMSTDCNTSNNTFRNIRINGGTMGIQLIRRFRTVAYNWICQNNDIGDSLKANSIVNASSNTASFTTGIYGTNAGAINISGNRIGNLSAAGGTVYGINLDASNSQSVSQNTIYNLSNTHTSQAYVMSGIHVTGSSTYEKNFIHSLSASSSSATINGIYATTGPYTISNNIVRIGITSTGSGLNTGTIINGINENTGSNSLYCNSVYIGGNPASTANSTYAFRSASVSASRNYVNNIFFNARSNNSGSTGKHYAIQLASNSGCTSKNNDLYVSGTGGVLGFYSADRIDLNAWKTATLLDTNSLSGNPNFINPTGDAANVNLHIDTTTASPVSNAGIPVAGITTDFDGNLRNASTPDIGADEFTLNIKMNLTMFIEGFYNASSDLQVSDTIKVYLRNSGSPYAIADSANAVLSDSGKAALTFRNAASGNYYIQLANRNILETWSANAVAMTQGNTVSYNFTNASSQAYGNNMKQIDASPVRFGIYSGDINKDGAVDLADIVFTFNDASAFTSGYVITDLNGDGLVDLVDLTITYNNATAFVNKIVP